MYNTLCTLCLLHFERVRRKVFRKLFVNLLPKMANSPKNPAQNFFPLVKTEIQYLPATSLISGGP